MILELHDNNAPTLCGIVRNIDYMYQAEQWVIDTCKDCPLIILWLLFTDSGEPGCAWKRVGDSFEDCLFPKDTTCDPRSLKPRTDTVRTDVSVSTPGAAVSIERRGGSS